MPINDRGRPTGYHVDMVGDGRRRNAQAMAVFLARKHRRDAVRLASSLKATARANKDSERTRFWGDVLKALAADAKMPARRAFRLRSERV